MLCRNSTEVLVEGKEYTKMVAIRKLSQSIFNRIATWVDHGEESKMGKFRRGGSLAQKVHVWQKYRPLRPPFVKNSFRQEKELVEKLSAFGLRKIFRGHECGMFIESRGFVR
jgi:hypothetical protein